MNRIDQDHASTARTAGFGARGVRASVVEGSVRGERVAGSEDDPMTKLRVNGEDREATSAADTPLLYVLRDELGVMTPKFGCGMAQCGACSVLLDGAEIRSCITPISFVAGKEVTTVEGLPARWAKLGGRPAADAEAAVPPAIPTAATQAALHPVQEAWIEEQVPQCGICQFGMMIKVTELLEANPDPTDDEIKAALTTSGPSPHLCRCASYAAILDGVHHAARLMARGCR